MTRVTVTFLTVADELIETATLAHDHLQVEGYIVEIEPSELGYPNTPTFRCTNGPETLIVEVEATVPLEALKQWSAYCQSCSSDTRLALVVPAAESITGDEISSINKMGIGLYVALHNDWQEIAIPTDLAVNIKLPDLRNYSNPVRSILGSSFRDIRRGLWKDGFATACEALAQQAKSYLVQEVNKGRIRLKNPSGTDVTNNTLSRGIINIS